ncbi:MULTISPECIES: hypothetical protein [Legionella]|uniref:Uncharacterized protein n=1 Tax=Legionella drozanskii LLAP-1 TaxID=1212489 RepID=A0A0W0SMW1_9GAMM|nr:MULTISPECIES: hypothetical protein [Legionella]KTC84680.1 hypothetical protein Ldro_2844 [Legionella drozanskii LLAP-1]PJE07887.1 MAG: hypothetical protein CK430_13335 [Legionella sp.]
MHKLTSYKLTLLLILNLFSILTASAGGDVCGDNSYHARTIYNYSTQTWFIDGWGNSIPGLGGSSVWFEPCNGKTSVGCPIPPQSQISISYVGTGGLVPRPPAGSIRLTDKNGVAHDFWFECLRRDLQLEGSVASTVMSLNQPRGGDIHISGNQY